MIDVAVFCLALTGYHEARSEPEVAEAAVMWTALNRARDPRWPSNVCDVVRDQTQYQFRMVQPRDRKAWERSERLARGILAGRVQDPTHGAKWYHSKRQRKNWSDGLTPLCLPGAHVFWRESAAVSDAAFRGAC